MAQKIHCSTGVIAACLLQACANPLGDLGKLDGNSGVQAAETAISAVRNSGDTDTVLSFPQSNPSPVEISLQTRAEELEKISPATKLICIANPNSPTGTVISVKDLETIIKVALENEVMVLIDEAYFQFWSNSVLIIYRLQYPRFVFRKLMMNL